MKLLLADPFDKHTATLHVQIHSRTYTWRFLNRPGANSNCFRCLASVQVAFGKAEDGKRPSADFCRSLSCIVYLKSQDDFDVAVYL